MRLVGKGVQVNPEGQADFSVIVSGTEDLWHLYNFITPGDIVGTKTVRKVVKESAIGGGTSERRVLTLHIVVSAVDFDAGGILRLSGTNRTETEYVRMNAHHTLEILCEPPQTVHIHKSEWNSFLEERLKEACDEDSRSDTAAIIMDYGVAQVCLVNGSLVITKLKIEQSIPKKRKMNASSRDDSIGKFFGHIYDGLLSHVNLDTVKVILVCSPGTLREEFMTFLNQKLSVSDLSPNAKALQQQRSKLLPVMTSTGQRNAINEALADRLVQQRMATTKCAMDIKVWGEFEQLLSTDPDRVCYGPQYVVAAQQSNAIEALLISDACFRSSEVRLRRFYLALSDEVKEYGGTVNVFSTQHTTGEALAKLSGVAAILRMPMPELEDLEQELDFLEENPVIDEMIMARAESQSSMQGQRTSSSLGA